MIDDKDVGHNDAKYYSNLNVVKCDRAFVASLWRRHGVFVVHGGCGCEGFGRGVALVLNRPDNDYNIYVTNLLHEEASCMQFSKV